MRIRNFSFGGTSAIVTNMGLIIGFDQTSVSKSALLSGLLIVAIADNLTDSLSIHIYQESEQLEEREAFRATLTNFMARFSLSLSFMLILILFPSGAVTLTSMIWGIFLLTGLTYYVARSRKVRPVPEIWKHLLVALVVIAISRFIGRVLLK